MATKIGFLMKLDESTLQTTRGKYARMRVEINLSRPLLSKYHLHRQIRRIEYEGIHQICLSSKENVVAAPMGGVLKV